MPKYPMGWLDIPARHSFAAQYPFLSQVAPHLVMAPPAGDIAIYKALREALGDYPDYPPQEIGDCTSFGAGHGVDLLAAVQIVIDRRGEAWKESCTEALYGEGREIAGMLGGGDGCFGGALAQAVSTVGVVPREAVGAYSGKRAKEWGRTGTPEDIKGKSRDHLVKTVAKVQTWDELRSALGNGYPVTVASNQGFEMTRNAKGICEAKGSWPHQMLIAGILWSNTPDECAVIFNSWGNEAFQGPTPGEFPLFAFCGRKRVVERMIGAGDSWAYSAFQGFPGRPLPTRWSYGGFA